MKQIKLGNLTREIGKSVARQFSESRQQITCPGCSNKVTVSGRDIRGGASTTCRSCGAKIEFTGPNIAQQIERSFR